MTPAKIQHVPRRAGTIAMWLFLAALGMLFAASIVGYVLTRVWNTHTQLGTVPLPKSLWVSTLMMLAASYTMHRALGAIRREKQQLFRTYLNVTLVLASVFVCIQTPAMIELLHEHRAAAAERDTIEANTPAVVPHDDPTSNEEEVTEADHSLPPFALIMVLILIHALHVVGGIISLGTVAYHGYRGGYDHEHYTGVNNCVLYWHFLDAVWLIMFTVIIAFR